MRLKRARAYKERRLADPDLLGVRAIDSYALVVKLGEPCGYFLHIMAAAETMPIPRHAVERYGPSWTDPGKIVTNSRISLLNIIRCESSPIEAAVCAVWLDKIVTLTVQ